MKGTVTAASESMASRGFEYLACQSASEPEVPMYFADRPDGKGPGVLAAPPAARHGGRAACGHLRQPRPDSLAPAVRGRLPTTRRRAAAGPHLQARPGRHAGPHTDE